jgi:hypothetical protein
MKGESNSSDTTDTAVLGSITIEGMNGTYFHHKGPSFVASFLSIVNLIGLSNFVKSTVFIKGTKVIIVLLKIII